MNFEAQPPSTPSHISFRPRLAGGLTAAIFASVAAYILVTIFFESAAVLLHMPPVKNWVGTSLICLPVLSVFGSIWFVYSRMAKSYVRFPCAAGAAAGLLGGALSFPVATILISMMFLIKWVIKEQIISQISGTRLVDFFFQRLLDGLVASTILTPVALPLAALSGLAGAWIANRSFARIEQQRKACPLT